MNESMDCSSKLTTINLLLKTTRLTSHVDKISISKFSSFTIISRPFSSGTIPNSYDDGSGDQSPKEKRSVRVLSDKGKYISPDLPNKIGRSYTLMPYNTSNSESINLC